MSVKLSLVVPQCMLVQQCILYREWNELVNNVCMSAVLSAVLFRTVKI